MSNIANKKFYTINTVHTLLGNWQSLPHTVTDELSTPISSCISLNAVSSIVLSSGLI